MNSTVTCKEIMANTQPAHISYDVFSQQSYSPKLATTLRRVWQDKPRATPDPRSLTTAWNGREYDASASMDTNTFRSQNPIRKHSTKRRKKKVSIWLDPPEVAKLEGKAKSEGLSISATGAAFLKRGMQAEADMHYSAVLQPIIETTIRNELRRFFKQVVFFLARIALSLDVIKGLVKWLCRRLAGATKAQVDVVEEKSRKDARVNLGQRSPQLEKLTKEYENALYQEQEGTT
jgi:hypothetical protein